MTDDRSPSPSAGLHPPTIAEQRVSSLVGDRLCIRCAYNLVGQPVLREPHYEMLIVRCPECATVASVQEYPLLGRWANRWAAVAAGFWFLFIVALWIGTGAMIFGFSVGAGEWSAERLSSALYEDHQRWSQAQVAATATTAQNSQGLGNTAINFKDWWESADRATFIAKRGGWLALIEWQALLLWIPQGILSFTMGCVWAMILLGQRVPARLLWGGFIMAVAAAFSIVAIVDWIDHDASTYWRAARKTVSPIFFGITLAFGAFCLGVGLVVGRIVIRWLLCLLLPPRFRSPLAIFWLADGLKPPTTI